MDKKKLDELIEYEGPFGKGQKDFWDDYETFSNQILRYKIIKVRIYFNGNEKQEEYYIVGIGFTYENLFTGEIREIEHKGCDKISGMKALEIKSGDYIKQFHINFKDDFERISQIGFTTIKNKSIKVGIKDGTDKYIKQNTQDKIYIGSYGFISERLDGIGCLFVSRTEYLKAHLFWFFMMRKLINKDEAFRKKWEVKYIELDMVYRFIWKAMLLPDTAFAKIIKYCIA
jgi:hypothetical protein